MGMLSHPRHFSGVAGIKTLHCYDRMRRSCVTSNEEGVVVGMGSVGMDYLASVASFPRPDDKMRTQALEMQGGGNCGNALTATARLGRHLKPRIVSKIGCDSAGDAILAEFQEDGVDTDFIIRSQTGTSPFTYIIVDQETNTRTCIHTPGEAFTAEEMTPELVQAILHGATAVYFDGRLAEAAIILAQGARERDIPVLVEAERLRPGLDGLLHLADFVVTSAHFPREWTGHENIAEAMVEILGSLPHAQWISTTLGSRGALMLEKSEHGGEGAGIPFSIDDLFAKAKHDEGAMPYVIVREGDTSLRITARSYAASAPFTVEIQPSTDNMDAERVRREAAERAALMNADLGKGDRYRGAGENSGLQKVECANNVRRSFVMTAIEAADIPQKYIVDTTGAGDAFIGTMLFSIASGISPVQGASLGCLVAAVKCMKLGARPGLPRIEDIYNMSK